MTQSKITATQGRQIKQTQRKATKHIAVEPKSRLNQQAADRETILVRRVIIVVLLLIELLLGWLLIVWQVNTRGETNMSTFECTQQDILNVTYKMQSCLYGGVGRLYIGFATHDG